MVVSVTVLKENDQNFLGTYLQFSQRNWYHSKALVE